MESEMWDEKIKGVQTCTKPNQMRTKSAGVGTHQKMQIVQNALKHILALEFSKSDKIFWKLDFLYLFTDGWIDGHYSDQISGIALETARLKTSRWSRLMWLYHYKDLKSILSAPDAHSET